MLLKAQRQGFEKLSSNSSDKSNLLRKVDFVISLELGCFVIIIVNFVYK